jgi:hypothetical protein
MRRQLGMRSGDECGVDTRDPDKNVYQVHTHRTVIGRGFMTRLTRRSGV